MNKKELKNMDFDIVIDTYTPYVRKIIDNMSSSNLSYEDKEEILSDTFFILWKNRNEEIQYLDGYIAGIARNLVKEKFKKSNITYNIDFYENELKYTDNVENFLDEREVINKLEIGYKALDDIEFKILSMFYYSAKSVKDIAKELNMSQGNVKTRLFRIRKKLKKYLL